MTWKNTPEQQAVVDRIHREYGSVYRRGKRPESPKVTAALDAYERGGTTLGKVAALHGVSYCAVRNAYIRRHGYSPSERKHRS